MSATTSVIVGDKGRIVVPSEVRSRRNWTAGTVLVLVETDDGLLLTERSTALARVRATLGHAPLVDELIADRRRESSCEDAST